MTYVVTEDCIKCKYMDCVEVCPVDCFYDGDNMLVIHPDECIDCGVCALMGQPADKRLGAQGATVYWNPQLPYGHASYAARIAPDGHLIAGEQRLTEENVARVAKGVSAEAVLDLLGPPYQPTLFSN